jgi:four helix bundle protein
MGTVEEEADECLYWMELLAQSGTARLETLKPLMKEADELLAITVASIKTAKRHSRRT